MWNCLLDAWEASQAPQPAAAAVTAGRAGQFALNRRPVALPGLPAQPWAAIADSAPPQHASLVLLRFKLLNAERPLA